MAKYENVTTKQVADYLGLSQRTVRNIMNELIEDGLVGRIDSYRHAKYMLKNSVCKSRSG